jgi:hypothetical protein
MCLIKWSWDVSESESSKLNSIFECEDASMGKTKKEKRYIEDKGVL